MKKQEYKERWEKAKAEKKTKKKSQDPEDYNFGHSAAYSMSHCCWWKLDRSGYGGKTAFGSQKSFFCGRSAF